MTVDAAGTRGVAARRATGARHGTDRHLRLAVRRLARPLLPARAAAAPRARLRRRAADERRGQRLLLLPAAALELAVVGRAGARGLRLRREGPALRHAHEEAGRRRGAARHLPRLGRAVAGRAARPAAVAAAAQPRLPPRPPRRVLRPAAAHDRRRVGVRRCPPRRGQAQGARRHLDAGRPPAAPRARGAARRPSARPSSASCCGPTTSGWWWPTPPARGRCSTR